MNQKQIHIVELQSFQALVDAGYEVFARTPVAVRTVPHMMPCFAGNDQFITVGFLPHRFYLKRSGEALRLMVLRGKIKVVEQVIVTGQVVEFEGMTFSIHPGSEWIALSIRNRQTWFLPVICCTVLALGLALRKRK